MQKFQWNALRRGDVVFAHDVGIRLTTETPELSRGR
jgi:hypothetical protein